MTTLHTSPEVRTVPARACLLRLIALEFQKLTSVRSGRGVLASMLLIGVLISLGICWIVSREQDAVVSLSVVLAGFLIGVGLGSPILGVLIMTMDWQHRDALSIFTLEPRRHRIFIAKLAASLLLGLGLTLAFTVIATVTSLGFAAIFALPWEPGDLLGGLGMLLATSLVGAVSGAALASALLSAPLSIVVLIVQFLLIDNLLSFLPGGIGPYLRSVELGNFLFGEGSWDRALSSAVLWIVLPLFIGYQRMVRKEPS